MMNKPQQKNQQQIQDLSAQLQTGLRQFLQQSMEQMFNHLALAQTQPPAAASTTPPSHIVSFTLVSAIPPAKSEEPMDSAPCQPAPPEVKKGLTKIKGSSAIAQQSSQPVVTQVKVSTSTRSRQPPSAPATVSALSFHLIFKPWNKSNMGLMLQSPPSLSPQSRKTLQKLENRRLPLTFHSGNWSKKLGSSCPSLTQQQKRTISRAHHWDVIPFSCNMKCWIDLISHTSHDTRPILASDGSGQLSQTKYVKFFGDRKISGHSTTQGKLVQCSRQLIFTDTTGGSPGLL